MGQIDGMKMAKLEHPHKQLPASAAQRRRDTIRREMYFHWQRLSEDALLGEAARRNAWLLLLHEKYGYTRQAADDELDHLMKALRNSRAAIFDTRGKR